MEDDDNVQDEKCPCGRKKYVSVYVYSTVRTTGVGAARVKTKKEGNV
jgi:hypothetical protein